MANFAKTAAENFFTEHKRKLDKQILDLKEKLFVRDNDTKLNNYNKIDITNKTNYGSCADYLGVLDKTMMTIIYVDKIINEINSINQSFDYLVNKYRNRYRLWQ